MTIATVKTKINDWLAGRWVTLKARQETYYANNGHYFQGLWTHNAEVTQTDSLDNTAADNLTSKPTDQTHTWRDFLSTSLDAPIPARLKIDVYDGPKGKGWQAVLQVKYKNKIYQRTKQVGPESYRTHDWIVQQ